MSYKQKFADLATLHGVTFEYRPGGTVRTGPNRGEKYAAEIMLDAPHGKIFNTTDCHCDGSLNHTVEDDGTRTDWPGAYAGLLAIVKDGFSDCPDRPNCEICNHD